MKPYSPIPRYVTAIDHSQLIHRLLRRDVIPETQRIDLITTTQLRLSIIDSGHAFTESTAKGDMFLHVLWQSHEADAWLSIAGDRYAIAPGDSVAIPSGDTWQLSRDQLAITLSVRQSSLALPVEPTHGEERSSGFNRETTYPLLPGNSVTRWKLTGPLCLPTSTTDQILVALYGDMALNHDGGIDMLSQGEVSVIRPQTGSITLIPNGLSYIFIVS